MLGKPFVTTSEPLGQELGNYHYISREKLGLVTYKYEQTFKVLINLIKNPSTLKTFQVGIKKHQKLYKNTPKKVTKTILNFL